MWVGFAPALEPKGRKFRAVPTRIDWTRDLLWLELSPNAPYPKTANPKAPVATKTVDRLERKVYSTVAGTTESGMPTWHVHIGRIQSETVNEVVARMTPAMCRGDSGGPLFVREDNAPVLLGVLHGGVKHDDLDIFSKVRAEDLP